MNGYTHWIKKEGRETWREGGKEEEREEKEGRRQVGKRERREKGELNLLNIAVVIAAIWSGDA